MGCVTCGPTGMAVTTKLCRWEDVTANPAGVCGAQVTKNPDETMTVKVKVRNVSNVAIAPLVGVSLINKDTSPEFQMDWELYTDRTTNPDCHTKWNQCDFLQHTIQPGEEYEFSRTMKAPYDAPPGDYEIWVTLRDPDNEDFERNCLDSVVCEDVVRLATAGLVQITGITVS